MQIKRWLVCTGLLMLVASAPVGLNVAFRLPVVEAQAARSTPDAPHIGKCPVFPKDNIWNTRIDSLPVSKHSADYLGTINANAKVHADFSANPKYGIPYAEVPPGTKPVKVKFEYAGESDEVEYPIPPDAMREGAGSNTGDRHILLIDPATCVLYETWHSQPQPDGTWKAGSGAKFELTSNALRHSGFTSADAAGLPIFPGLVRYDEVATGAINHALRFTVDHSQANYLWPATHRASRITDPKFPPLGARFRLRADFDISEYSKTNRIILTALKRYGMFLADNGGSIYISGAPDKRWDDDDLHKLAGITAKDFEVVDESNLQLAPDSAKVDPKALKP